jgi:hypothetical protein
LTPLAYGFEKIWSSTELSVDDQIIFELLCISDFVGMQDGKNTIDEPVHQITYQGEKTKK